MGHQTRRDPELPKLLNYEASTGKSPHDDPPGHLTISSMIFGGMSLLAMVVGFSGAATAIFPYRVAPEAFRLGALAGGISILLLLMSLFMGERGRILAAAGLLLCASLSVFIASRVAMN